MHRRFLAKHRLRHLWFNRSAHKGKRLHESPLASVVRHENRCRCSSRQSLPLGAQVIGLPGKDHQTLLAAECLMRAGKNPESG